MSNNNNGQSSKSRSESPTKRLTSAIKAEPERDMHPSHNVDNVNDNDNAHEQGQGQGPGQRPYSDGHRSPASPHLNELDNQMEYTDDTPVHPLASVPQLSSPSSLSSSTRDASTTQGSPYTSAVQPQQHQQLLKLKTEHGFPSAPLPLSTPDIVMTNDDSDDASRAGSPASSMGSSEPMIGDDSLQHMHQNQHEKGHLVVDTSSLAAPSGGNGSSSRATTPNTTATPSTPNTGVDTPLSTGQTAPSSRRPSLRTMTATLPRSALQEETIALFKQYRNLIPCAKCFCRNTIQRDGMSDGNLRFKCRPPVSMSLICNKSYSESKIRNMIAGVVYGHSLPDSNTPTSATSPGDNELALAPPPPMTTTKASRRTSTKIESSPRIGPEVMPDRMQRLQEDQERDHMRDEREADGSLQSYPLEARRPSTSNQMHQSNSSRRGSMHHLQQPSPHQHSHQQIRRSSTTGDESMMMMDYEDVAAQLPPLNHSSHLQVPGTPPLESEDPRLYRSRSVYGQQQPSRSMTPAGPGQPPQQVPARQLHKLHHSHSHPNIGQQRHQQYLEQQEREHRGSISNAGYSNQGQQPPYQQQQQRPIPRQVVRRDSSQYLGGSERRSSQPSPVMNVSGSKYMSDDLSPAISSSPRSSPGRELMHQHQQQGQASGLTSSSSLSHDPAGTPTLRAHHGSSRYDDSTNSAGYFQRRMSQPHPSHAYSGNGGSISHQGLPPPMPSPLSHPYDRRASEAEEYPQVHREKYERLNANTLLAPSSTTSSSRHSHQQQQQSSQSKVRSSYPLGSPNAATGPEARQHPLDAVEPVDDTSRQAMTPPMRSAQHPGAGPSASTSLASSPWMNGSGDGSSNMTTPQSEPMRYSHSLPMGQHRPSLRHHYSSSSLYYQTPRPEESDRFDSENDRDMSPDYQDVDADGRPIARMRGQGVKRKSLGQSLSRSSSNQNLYSTNLQHQQYQYGNSHHHQQSNLHSHQHQHQHHQHRHHQQQQQQPPPQSSTLIRRDTSDPQDINAVMPRNAIKLTCFPNGSSKTSTQVSPTARTLSTSEALALQLGQMSKIVIEIRQPRSMQAYGSSGLATSSSTIGQGLSSTNGGNGNGYGLRRSNSHPNKLLTRSSSSVLGCRRSPSPDPSHFGGSTLKRRRGDSATVPTSGSAGSEDALLGAEHSSVAEAAAAAVVAAAAAAAHTPALGNNSASSQDESSSSSSSSLLPSSTAIQIIGMDYLAKSGSHDDSQAEGVGLGLSTTTTTTSTSTLTSSPTIEALRVAQGSSYVLLEDQKEVGIDYSLFTRVETAGWRILIPPNVIASFRSEDFGLMLKPKGVEEEELLLDGGLRDREEEEFDVKEEELEKKDGVVVDRRTKEIPEDAAVDLQSRKEVVNQEAQVEDEEDDVNIEGVRRIALRDDDGDNSSNVETTMTTSSSTFTLATVDDHEMVEACRNGSTESNNTTVVAVEQDSSAHTHTADMDMDKEQDELLEDD
ncbi:hypothetical protein BGZ98_001226 [Dissophora globulifera]|nr:hypothetical protein BGZ98_001226 [Dissophora globulifera]